MKKTKMRIFATLLAVTLYCTAFSTTAFAGGGEDTTEPAPEVTETPTPTPAPAPLTPDGNLTLVDDIDGEQATSKQFVTMQSKNGNYFYLVIDRDGDKENVYFLNLVDEADLMALIEDDATAAPVQEVCSCTDECTTGAVNTSCPVCKNDLTKCSGKTAEETEPEKPEKKNNSMGMLALLLIVGILGVGAFYYFKVLKNKPKTKGNSQLDEYEFDDDEDDDTEEEYETEDDTEDTEQEADTK